MGKSAYLLLTACLFVLLSGCSQQDAIPGSDINEPVPLDKTIGEVANIYQSGAVRVRGFGLVAGLAGNGSSECPPALRRELIRYIQKQTGMMSPDKANSFINSEDTAVVVVYGTIPAVAIRGDHFDIKVKALENTQTTSLSGGKLLLTELKEMRRVQSIGQYAKTIATAEGAIFLNKLSDAELDERTGYILGGGKVDRPVQLSIGLIEPNYFTASAIRNQLNNRFGTGTARAVSPGEIEFEFPDRYLDQRGRFIEMVRQSFLVSNPERQDERIQNLVKRLVSEEDKVSPALSLETIGALALDSLAPLLRSPNEAVRYHAASTMLAIGDDRAYPVLAAMVKNPQSEFRLAAVRSIGQNAKIDEIKKALRPVLADHSPEIRLAAHEQLVDIQDELVVRRVVDKSFFVDGVVTTGPGLVYVTRAEVPKIVIFGSPMRLEQDIFAKTPGDEVIINAGKGDQRISVMRQHPKRARLVGPVFTSYRLRDLVQKLGESPVVDDKSFAQPGLGVPYDTILVLLRQLAETGKIPAEFMAGEMTTVDVP